MKLALAATASLLALASAPALAGEAQQLPHGMLVTTDAGDVQEWKVEGGAPNALIRRGWNRNSILPGTRVCVEGFQARDGSFRANGREVLLDDGSNLFMGSTGIGAPPVAEAGGGTGSGTCQAAGRD